MLLKHVGYHVAQTTFLTEQILEVTTRSENSWPASYLTKEKKNNNTTESKPTVIVLTDIKKNLLAMDYGELSWETACLSRCL